MTETFVPFRFFCNKGQADATVYIPGEVDPNDPYTDNVYGFVESPCKGCTAWSVANLVKTVRQIKNEAVQQFGSDDPAITGIEPQRNHALEVHLVDRSRFTGGDHKLVVGTCGPIFTGKL